MVAAAYSYPSAEHPRMTYRIKAQYCVILRTKFWKLTQKYTAVVAKKLNGTYAVVNEENRMRGRDRAIKTLRRYEIVYGCVTTERKDRGNSAEIPREQCGKTAELPRKRCGKTTE